MFTDECSTIVEGIENADEILNILIDEGLVENAYGDDIRSAIRLLRNAKDAVDEIEYADDPNDGVDLEELARDVEMLESSIEEIQSSASDAESKVEEIGRTLRDYR